MCLLRNAILSRRFAYNAIGTYRLVLAALEHGAAELILVSTDKAASPRSLMGVSKRLAELIILSLDSKETVLKAVPLWKRVWLPRQRDTLIFTADFSRAGQSQSHTRKRAGIF